MLDVLVRVWKNEKLLFWLFACCGQFQFSELFLLATWARRQRRRRSTQHRHLKCSTFHLYRRSYALRQPISDGDLLKRRSLAFRPYGNEERKRAIRVGFGSKLCRRITWKHLDRVDGDGDRENSKELNFNGTFHPIVCVFGHHCYRCQFTDCFPTRRAHFLLRFLAIVANGSKIKSILLQLWKNVEKSNEACREGEKMCSHLSASNRISSKGVRFVDNGRPNCAVKYSLYHSVCGWSLQEWKNLWLIRLDYIWFEVLTDVSNFVVEPLFLPIIIIIHYEKQNSFPIFFFFFQVSG